MKILTTTALIILLMVTTALSLPVTKDITKSNGDIITNAGNEATSEIIAKEIINNRETKGSVQMAAGNGTSYNQALSTETYNPNPAYPTYENNKPAEYAGEHVIPEPITLILVGLGLTGLALRRRFL